MTQSDLLSQERYNPFRSIPRKKLELTVQDLHKQFSDENGVLTPSGGKLIDAVQRYYEANIPVDYWFREMSKFSGDKTLVKQYNMLAKNVADTYKNGLRICFAGKHGSGKTMTAACILKRVVETGKYEALYANLTDVVNILVSYNEDKHEARRLLLSVDFLVIDEFDQRFMGTDNAADLFGRIIEPILRTRIQNRLPLLLCTNSPSVTSGFVGDLKMSISSLMKLVKTVPVLGKDYRDEEGGG